MDWVQSLIVKFLEKIISVSIIRDIEESYLVSKNPMPLGVGVSVPNIKSSSRIRKNILMDFEKKYGIRPIIKEEPDWLK